MANMMYGGPGYRRLGQGFGGPQLSPDEVPPQSPDLPPPPPGIKGDSNTFSPYGNLHSAVGQDAPVAPQGPPTASNQNVAGATQGQGYANYLMQRGQAMAPPQGPPIGGWTPFSGGNAQYRDPRMMQQMPSTYGGGGYGGGFQRGWGGGGQGWGGGGEPQYQSRGGNWGGQPQGGGYGGGQGWGSQRGGASPMMPPSQGPSGNPGYGGYGGQGEGGGGYGWGSQRQPQSQYGGGGTAPGQPQQSPQFSPYRPSQQFQRGY